VRRYLSGLALLLVRGREKETNAQSGNVIQQQRDTLLASSDHQDMTKPQSTGTADTISRPPAVDPASGDLHADVSEKSAKKTEQRQHIT
jgi:hypothetical protein